MLVHRPYVVYVQRGIELAHDPPQVGRQQLLRTNATANMDLSCLHRTVTVGTIDHRSGTLAQRVVDGVAHHASDHIAPAAKCDMPANRLAIVQKTMNEFFVDDGLLRSGKVVEIYEIPSRAEGNCHRREIARS